MVGTLADLKSYLSITSTADDALLSRLLAAASDLVCGQMGRAFGVVAYLKERHLGDGGTVLVPDHVPVVGVTELRIGGAVVPEAVNAATDDGWFFLRDLVCVRGPYRFTDGALVEVSYSAGEDAPADIVQAVIELAALKYRERSHVGTASQTLAGQSVSFLPSIVPVSVQTVIDSYRLPRF